MISRKLSPSTKYKICLHIVEGANIEWRDSVIYDQSRLSHIQYHSWFHQQNNEWNLRTIQVLYIVYWLLDWFGIICKLSDIHILVTLHNDCSLRFIYLSQSSKIPNFPVYWRFDVRLAHFQCFIFMSYFHFGIWDFGYDTYNFVILVRASTLYFSEQWES